MTRAWLLVLVGCGRIGFDASGDALDAPASLVLHMPFDGNCANRAPRGMPGIAPICATPACPVESAGMHGTAMEFDGFDDHCLAAFDPLLQLVDGFTLSVWLFPVGVPLDRSAVSKARRIGSGASVELAVMNDETRFCTTSSALDEECLSRVPPITPDAWSHVALVWDGSEKRMYIDGALAVMGAGMTTWDDAPLILGADYENGGVLHHYRGRLDELRLHDAPLGESEIAALAARP